MRLATNGTPYNSHLFVEIPSCTNGLHVGADGDADEWVEVQRQQKTWIIFISGLLVRLKTTHLA